MAKKKTVSEEYFKEVLEKAKQQMQREEARKHHNQAVQMGKDLVLVVMLFDALGISLKVEDMEVDLAEKLKLKKYPGALKEVLAFYNTVKGVPALARACFRGFQCQPVEGKLLFQFNFETIPDSKLEQAVKHFSEKEEERP